MADDRADKQTLVGYFAHAREAATAWAALVLVTLEGDPVDFLYTEPVTLNAVAHLLLGARVDAYLVEKVLLEPLLQQAAGRVSLLCIDDPQVLQRRFVHDVPVAVLAPADVTHRHPSWWAEQGPGANGNGTSWWVAGEAGATAMAALRAAAAAMAPFSILDPFRQLRAAMAEVRAERG
jgi:hypothetical protein